MNWTEGTLYRHSRGKLRKANAEKQRQKEYFAKAHIRAAEQREARKNGPPLISYLEPGSALPEPPTDAFPPKQNSAHGVPHRRGRWGASVPTAEDTPKSEHLLPTVDQFLKEQVGKATSTNTAPSQLLPKGTQVERLRQRLLASKDWGASRIQSPVQVHNRPRPMPPHVGPTQPTRAMEEKPAHIAQSNRGLYPQKHTSHLPFLRGADVQIRVGSQEKRLKSSTIGSGSLAHQKQNASTEKSRHFMTSASVPSIFHPVPLRVIPSHLLLSSGSLDSANSASHLAQVGRTISPVPPSQKAENSTWKAWLEESSSAFGAQTNPEPHEPVAQPRISPGVSERQVRHQGYSPPVHALCTVSTQCEPKKGLHRGDQIDAWKTFVFGDDDSEEVERDAFSEARHDAARLIRPYDENSLPSIGDGDHSGHDSNIAMAGTSSPGNAEGSNPYERHFAIDNPNQSPRKIHEPASTGSQSTATSAEEHVVIPRYTPFANGHDSVAVEHPCVDTSPISNKHETAENITIAMSDASGESASVAISVPTCPTIAPVSLKRKRGRPRKRARDGRADIRALPNYSGDPIEEIEDDDDAPPPSLFGSLDIITMKSEELVFPCQVHKLAKLARQLKGKASGQEEQIEFFFLFVFRRLWTHPSAMVYFQTL
ncbi:uncharacterized protein B0T23DRAFT_401412 [Neurospora hispaniola]|uniref:Uncharacterized protein n=1 Tax=Neurospora hispaniola TaxID=588809 RepID=A0AAJ0IGC9_9PEZI|nr:hypothetical protein B0T23DRAFT_401412 [Neurospora hispaniola]